MPSGLNVELATGVPIGMRGMDKYLASNQHS